MSIIPSSTTEALLDSDTFRLLSASLEMEATLDDNVAQPHHFMRRSTLPCCLCGTMIYPNAANQCEACLAQKFDLHQLLNQGFGGQDNLTIHQCRDCRRFERKNQGDSSSQSNRYERCELESSELMALCLKHIHALNGSSTKGSNSASVQNLQVVDATWIWTEPHSMRLKLRLTVRATICERSIQIQQRVVVEFTIRFKQCLDCKREFTNKTWDAVVQVRQKREESSSRRSIRMIEMALAKSEEARKHVVRFETTCNGFDFYFIGLSKAQSFASFIARIAPVKVKTSSKLVSTDNHSNTANVKYTVSVDVVPICRDDLLVISRANTGHSTATATKLSGNLILVTKCKSVIHCVNASPSRTTSAADATMELHPDKYWKGGEERSFRLLLPPSRLMRFIVLDIELCDSSFNHDCSDKSRDDLYRFADVEVVRETDLGVNDTSFRCVTHLGNILKAGDIVLGYDLQASVLPNDVMENFSQFFNSTFELPDVVLVRKGSERIKTLNTDEKPTIKSRSKSSASRRRHRRRQKEEEKVQNLRHAAGRMGLLDDEEALLTDADDVSLAENIEALDEEMKDNINP